MQPFVPVVSGEPGARATAQERCDTRFATGMPPGCNTPLASAARAVEGFGPRTKATPTGLAFPNADVVQW